MKPTTKWMEQNTQIVINYICEACNTCFCIVGDATTNTNQGTIEIESENLKGSWIIPKSEHTDEIF